MGNTIVHKKPKGIPNNYSSKLALFIDKLLAKNSENRPSAKEALKMVPKSVKNLDRFKKKIVNDSDSDLNKSIPYDQGVRDNIFNHAQSQDNENYRMRPISAAVIRSPNVRIKELSKDKRDFKI